MTENKLLRMDNVGIVVEDLKAAIGFFGELGFELEGEMSVEGEWVDRVVGLAGVRNDIAMMKTPDGHNKIELMKFQKPLSTSPEIHPEVNTLGIRRMMFAVGDIDDMIARLRKKGAEPIGELVQYGDTYRLCYLRGPGGLIVALAQESGRKQETTVAKSKKSALQRMDNILIVVQDLEATKNFFSELGMKHEGETLVEGPLVDKLIGLRDVRATLSVLRTPDGHGSIELDKFHSPEPAGNGADTPVNTPGLYRLMFAVKDIDDVVARLQTRGARLVGEVVRYEDMYRLCYLRGPEGIIIALAEQLSDQ